MDSRGLSGGIENDAGGALSAHSRVQFRDFSGESK